MTNVESVSELALNGGDAVALKINQARSTFGNEEKEAVMKVFDEALRTGDSPGYAGKLEEEYCKNFSEYLGGGFADGVNSGTNAVYVALRSLDLEPFGEVVYSCINDAGGVMPIALLGFIPVPADTQKDSFNIGSEQIEAAITKHTRAIVVAHIAGYPIDMKAVMGIAKKHNLPVVEDCSQAHGASIHDQKLGTFGDVAAFSTMFGKHHCTGGQGGIVFTKSEKIFQKVKWAADRGKPFGLKEGSTNCIASLNNNLNEVSAAIGIEQLKKLPSFLERRRKNANLIRKALQHVSLASMNEEDKASQSAYWWLPIKFEAQNSKVDKDQYCNALIAEGLPVISTYDHRPHTHDWYQNKTVFGKSQYPWAANEYNGDKNKVYNTPNAIQVIKDHFLLMLHEGHLDEDIDLIIKAFQKCDHAFKL